MGLTKLGWVAILITVLIVMIASVGTIYAIKIGQNHTLIVQNRVLAQKGVKAHLGLCLLSDDIRNRINDDALLLARSKDAFKKNPNLLPGVPKALIQQGWAQQEATIKALRITRGKLLGAIGPCDVS